MSEPLTTQIRLSLEWELWVIEQLLFSAKLHDLVDVLVAQGVEQATAQARVLEIMASPTFTRIRRRLGEARLAANLGRLQTLLDGPQVEVPVRASISSQALLEHHWVASRPLLLTEQAGSIPAVHNWSLDELGRRFPELRVEVNTGRLKAKKHADTESESQWMTLAQLVARTCSGPSNDFYVVSRNGLLARPELASLWEELVDLPAFLQPLTPPRGVSLWLGPAGTVTPPHFDPHNVLLVQVQGRKRVRLGSRLRAGLHAELDGYYLARPLDEVFAANPGAVATVELHPGQALFIPAAWFHEVTALDCSMTLSFLNFGWPNHYHWLGPPGSDDHDQDDDSERTN